MHISTVVSLIVLAAQVASINIVNFARSQLPGLLARQDPGSGVGDDIPSQCTIDCGVLDTIDNCTDDQCFCTDSNMSDLQSCFDCIFSVFPDVATQQVAQQQMDNLTQTCDQEGYSVQSISIVASGTPASAPAQPSDTGAAPTGTQSFNTAPPSVTFDSSSPGAGTSPTSSPPAGSSTRGGSTSAAAASTSGPSGGGQISGSANAGVMSTVSGGLLVGAVGGALLALRL